MEVRTHYFATLENLPYSFDFTPAWPEYNADFSVGMNKTLRQRCVAYTDRVIDPGLREIFFVAYYAIRCFVLDSYFTLRATLRLVKFNSWNEPNFKNLGFAVWNLTIADSALVFSIFTGIIMPSSRHFAACLHKGDFKLDMYEKAKSEAEIELEIFKQFV